MLAQFGNFKLFPGKRPQNARPSPDYGFTFGDEPAHFRFYEHEGDTYLTMYFREFSQSNRIVTLDDKPVDYLDDHQQDDLGTKATAEFAEHIQSPGQPPKDLSYLS